MINASASDEAGNVNIATYNLEIDNTLPKFKSVEITDSNIISPQNKDGKYDSVTIKMTTDEEVRWLKTWIETLNHSSIKSFKGTSLYVTSHQITWNGKIIYNISADERKYYIKSSVIDDILLCIF